MSMVHFAQIWQKISDKQVPKLQAFITRCTWVELVLIFHKLKCWKKKMQGIQLSMQPNYLHQIHQEWLSDSYRSTLLYQK